MATVNWPNVLPDCAQTWQEQNVDDVIRTEMECGIAKVRRRSAVVKRQIQVSWTLQASTYQYFMDFYETTCLQGVNPFYYKHPITRANGVYRFAAPPSFEMIAGFEGVGAYRANVNLEQIG